MTDTAIQRYSDTCSTDTLIQAVSCSTIIDNSTFQKSQPKEQTP